MNLIVGERDVVFVDGIPFLNADLFRPRTRLSGHQLLEVANGVVLIAFNTDLSKGKCQEVRAQGTGFM